MSGFHVVMIASVAFVLSSCVATGSNRFGMSGPREVMTVESLIKAGPAKTTMTGVEREMYDELMKYRKSKGLKPIPYSKSLSYVAKLHTVDLNTHTFASPANSHSWSPDGPWKSVNYTPDHKYARLMWDKPRELTSYRGNGYEIACHSSGGAGALECVEVWKKSAPHNAVIINEGTWSDIVWNAIGIGVYGAYAVVWFGEETDPL